MGYDYTAEHIETLLEHCREVGILTAPGFWDAPVETLRGYYNGIGPDAWSSRLRRLTTFLLRPFELAALPHDYEYATAPRQPCFWPPVALRRTARSRNTTLQETSLKRPKAPKA